MKTSSFSLLELMVVITIASVLAAVALPVYQKYILTSKFSRLVTVAQGLMDRSIAYSTGNGRFGSAYDLGLSTTQASGNFYGLVDNPAALDPALTRVVVGDGSGDLPPYSNPACGASGLVWLGADPALLGFPASLASGTNNVGIICSYFHISGTVHRVCSYWYGTPSVSGTDPLLPGMINGNVTSNWDSSTWGPALTAAGYYTATCQYQ